MSFMIKDDNILDKYNEIQDKNKEMSSIKFHSKPAYEKKNYPQVYLEECMYKVKKIQIYYIDIQIYL